VVEFTLLEARAQEAADAAPFHEWALPDGAMWTQFYRNAAGYLLRFPDLADFQVSADGSKVSCRPAPGVTDETPQHLYLNQVLPLVLNKLGKLVFHASAIELDGAAVAFVAESGRGKSTLAASFATCGYRLLSDDGMMVEAHGTGYQVRPSHPSLRLWEDSQEALLGADALKAPAVSFTSKARFLAGANFVFCQQPRALRQVYFLGDGSAPALTFQPLGKAEALMEWVRHSFLLDIEEKSMLASHFDQVAKLANLPICWRLDYPRRFDELARVRQAIIEHAQGLGAAA
jgi:hypothetical protein